MLDSAQVAEKCCTFCGKTKILSEFYLAPRGALGRHSRCIQCMLAISKSKPLEEHAKRNAKSRKKHGRRWAENRRRKRLENIEAARKHDREYRQEKLEKDAAFRVAATWRSRISAALKKCDKSDSSENLLGCSWDQFLGHLEINFTDGMRWDNYGQWHVDHIKPLAKFDLSKPEEQRKAFHWSNHQPLWAIDNLRKGTKVNG